MMAKDKHHAGFEVDMFTLPLTGTRGPPGNTLPSRLRFVMPFARLRACHSRDISAARSGTDAFRRCVLYLLQRAVPDRLGTRVPYSDWDRIAAHSMTRRRCGAG